MVLLNFNKMLHLMPLYRKSKKKKNCLLYREMLFRIFFMGKKKKSLMI